MGRTPEDIQNEWLVLRCQEGDADSLTALFRHWQPRLARLAWRLTADREAARDLVQDAWVAIVKGLRRLDDPARFRSWAMRIVNNKCVDWTRKRVVQRHADQDLRRTAPLAIDSGKESSREDEETRLLKAVATLPSEQRAMISLHYLEGMGVAEIASVLSLPAGTVKSRLFHARNSLRNAIERVES